MTGLPGRVVSLFSCPFTGSTSYAVIFSFVSFVMTKYLSQFLGRQAADTFVCSVAPNALIYARYSL